MSDSHHEILIVGGGAGGISVAARLMKLDGGADIAIVEPSDKHYYQPLWTLVGGGAADKKTTVRDQASVIPKGAKWIRGAVKEFDPEGCAVVLASGDRVTYDHLVVAAGIQIDWNAVEGLAGNVGRDGICSNYSFDTVDSTWQFIRSFTGGKALFTHPATPIKCGGAPQKIMYLAEDHFRRSGIRDIAVHVRYFCRADGDLRRRAVCPPTLRRHRRARTASTSFYEARPGRRCGPRCRSRRCSATFEHRSGGDPRASLRPAARHAAA